MLTFNLGGVPDAELAEALDTDRRFFRRLRRRRHRLRRAYPAEARLFSEDAPPGLTPYVWTTQEKPGLRYRVGLHLRAGIDTDELSDANILALTANCRAFYGVIDVD